MKILFRVRAEVPKEWPESVAPLNSKISEILEVLTQKLKELGSTAEVTDRGIAELQYYFIITIAVGLDIPPLPLSKKDRLGDPLEETLAALEEMLSKNPGVAAELLHQLGQILNLRPRIDVEHIDVEHIIIDNSGIIPPLLFGVVLGKATR